MRTGRRGAVMLAKLHRAGEPTAVRVPDATHEAMQGVGFIVAVTVVAEVGGFQRFDNPRQLTACLGLTPSEHSSSASVRRGGIARAGSGLARRAPIEGARSHRMQAPRQPQAPCPTGGAATGCPPRRLERAARDVPAPPHPIAAEKAKVAVITAIAREMAGSIWAIARATTPAKARGDHEHRRPTRCEAPG